MPNLLPTLPIWTETPLTDARTQGDLRYFLLMFGAIKAGYKMLFLSPRNSVAGHLNILDKADCHVFLSSKNAKVDHILGEREMKTGVVPELDDLLEAQEVPMYPYTKSFDEGRKDPCLVLHTTGSTGLPKPITWKLEILSTYEAWRTIPAIDGYVPTTEVYQEARRAYNAMPLFHTSGLNIGITMSLLLGVTTVFGAASVVPHAEYTDEIHKYAGVDASIGPPAIFEDLSQDPISLDRMGMLRYVLVCGAPLSQQAGDTISKHTRVISNFGATETACLPRLAPASEDWAYFYWHPTHSGIELRPHTDGLYELFLVRDPKLDLYQGIFSTFPDLDEYSMNDLYSKHADPNKSFLYKWNGRVDDVLVLNNGEKLAPALLEAGLRSNPKVKGAMVVGSGQFQPAALLDVGDEPPQNPEEKATLVEEIKPAIDEANRHAPAHGKLEPQLALFAEPDRPVQYLGQGKIQRAKTYELYKDDIEEIYRQVEDPDNQSDLTRDETPRVDFGDRESIGGWLHEALEGIVGKENFQDVDGDTALFEAGMDSLHVLRLVRAIKLQAKKSQDKHQLSPEMLTPRIVYSHPSLNELADYLLHLATGLSDADMDPQNVDSGYSSAKSGDESTNPQVITDQMEALLNKYLRTIPEGGTVSDRRHHASPEGATVLLTGSTGSLGTYLLHELLNDPSVRHIVCLDRAANASERYKDNARARGLPVAPTHQHGQDQEDRHQADNQTTLEFLQVDLADRKQYLGLGRETYMHLAATATHILHAAWPVNFNLSLASFEPAVAGVANLARLAQGSRHDALVLFVSSVAAVGGAGAGYSAPNDGNDKSERWVSETTVHEGDFAGAAAATGYGRSKLVAECLLARAAERAGVRAATCRVGIVAGPVERGGGTGGVWNVREYIPSVVVSSAYLGVFPATFPSRDRVDWIPVDRLSRILVEILWSASQQDDNDSSSLSSKTFHVVNPRPVSWSADVAADVVRSYPEDKKVRAVTFEQWVEALRASEEDGEGEPDVTRNPAIRLLDFYAGIARTAADDGKKDEVVLLSEASREASETLRGLGPVNRDWLETWMVQWGVKEAKQTFLNLLE